MIFKQIHSLPTNPNWGKIVLLALATVGAGFIVYQITKSKKLKVQPNSPIKTDKIY